jgi:hypothetical protein
MTPPLCSSLGCSRSPMQSVDGRVRYGRCESCTRVALGRAFGPGHVPELGRRGDAAQLEAVGVPPARLT